LALLDPVRIGNVDPYPGLDPGAMKLTKITKKPDFKSSNMFLYLRR
jgi:hypothetical protein